MTDNKKPILVKPEPGETKEKFIARVKQSLGVEKKR